MVNKSKKRNDDELLIISNMVKWTKFYKNTIASNRNEKSNKRNENKTFCVMYRKDWLEWLPTISFHFVPADKTDLFSIFNILQKNFANNAIIPKIHSSLRLLMQTHKPKRNNDKSI